MEPSNEAIEKYLEDTIVEYLQGQKDVSEHYFLDFDQINTADELTPEKQKSLFVIEELLDDLLHDVDRTIIYQEEYMKAYKAHHQYALFELADIIPGFSLDDTLIKKLCFREILLISNVDKPMRSESDKMKPAGLGGLCLKVELAQGMPPSEPLRSEDDIDKKIAERIKKIKLQMARSTAAVTPTAEPEDPLKKYEDFLQKQAEEAPQKFVVHLSSDFEVDGENAGSRIISWVDKGFHTLEERRTEYVFHEDKTSTEQILYYALQENKYFVKHRKTFNKTDETRTYYPLIRAKDLVGEGANFILMRYLAITKFKGIFELSTIYINGNLCRNVYECQGPQQGYVNGHPVGLCKIYRSVIEECGIIHLSVTVMTVYGLIVSHEWEGCPYIIHINPLLITEGKPVPYDCIALKKQWETNMELVSKYLDCRAEAEFKMRTYLKDHPDIHDMMADYLQSVLLLKPENIMPFTSDYFMNFEPYRLPDMPYFDDFGDEDKDESEMFW